TGAGIRVNRAALDQILALVEELAGHTAAAAPRLDGLLALRGVLESAEDEVETPEQRDARGVAILAGWGVALQQLAAMREAEGVPPGRGGGGGARGVGRGRGGGRR